MIKKIQQFVTVGLLAFAMLVPAVSVPVMGGVASADIAGAVCEGSIAASNTGSNCTSQTDANQGLREIARKVTNFFSILVGAISIIMLIYGGFRYITSGGDSSKVGNAKNTIIYAIIGLIIVVLAQVIVNFVITQTGQVTNQI